MDRNKLDQQLDRRMEKLDLRVAQSSGREPLREYNRHFFNSDVYYDDAVVEAKVIICRERLNGEYGGIYLDTYGPWILFKVIDVKSGDSQGNLCPGTVILAKWDNRRKVYNKYIYKTNPKEFDKEVQAMSSLLPVTAYEIVTGKAEI